jgi:hypothetical protein
MKYIIKIFLFIAVLLFILTNAFTQDLSIDELVDKIADLENRIEILEGLVIQKSVNTESPITTTVYNPEEPITVALIDMSYHASNASNDYANGYSDWLSFSFIFKNNGLKDIMAAKGRVIFMDVFEERWWSIGVTLDDLITSGEEILWEGSIDYNMFDDQQKKAKNTSPDKIKVRFEVSQIIYSDGERVDFE